MRKVVVVLGAFLLGASGIGVSENAWGEPEPVKQQLSFDRVFASPSLNGSTPRAMQLSPDGRTLAVLRNRPDDRERYDLWGYDRATGQWRMLVDSLKLSPQAALSEAEKMQRERQRIGNLKGIVSYGWTADSKAVLVPLDGDLYLAGLDGSLKRLTTGAGGELNAQLSPRGTFLSFLRDQRLWVGRIGANPAPVSPAESADTVHWGEAEFVAQEEMARFAGMWWAPDESRIAVERFDEAKVGIVTRAAIGAEGTQTFNQRYPAAGTPNAEVSLWVMDPDGGNRVEVDLGADKDIYLARVNWGPGGKLYVQREDRAQTRLDMLEVDPATGKSQILFTEQAREKSWITLSSDYRFLADGSLIWWSERNGYGHLWHFKDGKWRQLTKGRWMVRQLVAVDEGGNQGHGRVIFTATKDDVLAPQLYALDLAFPETIERLTQPGWATSAIADRQGHTLVITRSSPDHPPQSYIADSTAKRLAWVEENALTKDHPYAPFVKRHHATSFGTLKAADGTVLHWKMITPQLVPGKRYPVFFEHYGGPTAQTVSRDWAGALPQAIVAKGFIYFELDNRGSENRGVDFASQIWHAMGTVEVEDQLAGARYLKTLPFVDPKKIAIYGWSYGGYMTLKMLEANPGVYAAGIAGAPVTQWELYDTHYTERYLGDPKAPGDVYAHADALGNATKIADPLLLIHGLSDDNVVFENSSALIARMQANAVPFEMMLYPGHTHSVSGPKISVHLWNTIFAFLARNGIVGVKGAE